MKYNAYKTLGVLAVLLMVSVCEAKKPNVIYILADDLGYGEVGYNGQKKIHTPELDALARKGMRFSDHYCGNSVCAPSRCSLMTGKHPGHAYIRANSPGYPDCQTPLPEGTETVAKLMKRAGYATACIGKWGLGASWNSGNPNKQGFDYFFGYVDQRKAHNYYPEYLWRNDQKVMLNGKQYSHDLLTQEALKFIEDKKSAPFFLYLAYCIPHTQYQVPDLGQYKDTDWPEKMKIHAAMTSRMDGDIGKIVRLLETLNLDEDTLVIFNSDNGAHGQAGSEKFFDTSAHLRGLKRSMYEGGVRSPMIAYWPGKVPAGSVSDHMSAFWDFLPTMAELSGEPVKGNTDGISMLPTLMGQKEIQKKHRYLYWELYEGAPRCAVRMDKWKGIVADRRKGLNVELYDVTKDESEQKDLASEHPEVVDQIRQMMNEAHVPNPFWDKDNTPLFNAKAACEANGLEYVTKKKPKKQK